MFRKLLRKINTLILQDSTHENESKDIAVMIRILSITFVLYYALIFVRFSISPYYIYTIVSFLSCFGMILTFYFTYHHRPTIPLIIFLSIIIFSSFTLSIVIGIHSNFMYLSFISIPLIFFNIKWEIRNKVIGVIIFVLLTLIFYTISYKELIHTKQSNVYCFAISFINILLFLFTLTLTSYFYCKKFTQAEHKLYQYNKKLEKMASLDPLTGLMNRRGMADAFVDLQKEYKNQNHMLSIAIGDIDFFKKINDKYGHDCGDYILTSLSDILSEFMDGKGELCRWGGEEFLFAFNRENTDQVSIRLNDLCGIIRHTHFNFQDTDITLTMTFGLEEFNPYTNIEQTIKKADEKLYLGKESGRNKVVY